MSDDASWQGAAGRFAALCARGAARFDPAAARFIECLIARAEPFESAVRRRLLTRALQRLGELEAAFEQAQQHAITWLHQNPEIERAPVERALRDGDLKEAMRLGRRAARAHRRANHPWVHRRVQTLVELARSRRTPLPRGIGAELRAMQGGSVPGERVVLAGALSEALFRESQAELEAVLVAVRAADQVPDSVGHYNGLRLAARSLEVLAGLSPRYLRMLVQRLGDLATLQQLPEPKPARGGPRRRR